MEEELSRLEPVYLWADGLYAKAGLGKDKDVLRSVKERGCGTCKALNRDWEKMVRLEKERRATA